MAGIRPDATVYTQVLVEASTYADAVGHVLGWLLEHEDQVNIIRIELNPEIDYVTGVIRFSER